MEASFRAIFLSFFLLFFFFSLFSFACHWQDFILLFFIVWEQLFFKTWHTIDSLPHSSSRSLFFLFFCFSILSAPHLAFLGSHSHYATLAGTRPYISEYPVFYVLPLYAAVCLIYSYPSVVFFSLQLRLTGWWCVLFKLTLKPCRYEYFLAYIHFYLAPYPTILEL